ncbi:MAG: Coenzyme F420 hydrogenase/dehydrogenase, beta subunit C-terminal domain [Candidatus Bathyarchaeota archaeon]|nr:MAG: Coenzyme F420 hydrogenase/dehydrogenase, beta subunit C-terminal domain [Candidatus Bathyarchaeota archaeon]
MKTSKLGFEESLGKNVVETSRCVGCASCVVVCPFSSLSYDKQKPTLTEECKQCGICPNVCPRFNWSREEAEKFLFGKASSEADDFGICRRIVLAQTANKRILRKCQDGGAVSTLVAYALRNNLIDAAALSGLNTDKPLFPVPKLASTLNGIIESAGTRYAYSPNMLAFAEGIKGGFRKLAFVGTPCQIQAIRKVQMSPLKKFSNPIQLAIGLMCTECFSYDGLFLKHIEGEMGIDLHKIVKMNIKGKIIISLETGEEHTIPLPKAKQYARESCGFCQDFSAELADISAGGLGLSNWTLLVLRTKNGEELFDRCVEAGQLKTRSPDGEAFALKLLTKLSRKKKSIFSNS